MKDYHINVFYSDEDEAYIADIPDLPLCSAFGDSPEAAVHEAILARDLWLEIAREDGRPVPEPCYRPAIYQTGAVVRAP